MSSSLVLDSCLCKRGIHVNKLRISIRGAMACLLLYFNLFSVCCDIICFKIINVRILENLRCRGPLADALRSS